MSQISPAFEEVVEAAFARPISKRKEFNQLVQDLVAAAEEVNKDGRTPENTEIFENAQAKLLYFVLINQSHIVFD